MTNDLVAFLRARLGDDEADAFVAQEVERKLGRASVFRHGEEGMRMPSTFHYVRNSPTRVLAEVEAKLRIVDRCRHRIIYGASGDGGDELAMYVLRNLAVPYREHPDYQPEWAPDA